MYTHDDMDRIPESGLLMDRIPESGLLLFYLSMVSANAS